MKKDNKVLLVANYLHDHPKATGAQIAKKFKCAMSYAYVLMSKAKAIQISVEEVVDEIEEGIKNSRLGIPRGAITNEMPLTEVRDGKVHLHKVFTDTVNHPPHYKTGGIEVIDFIEAKNLSYHLGNVIKYIARADHKGNKKDDLLKAQWYLTRAINNLK
jgi:hypothetical protein